MSFLIKYFKVFIFSSIPVYSSIIILNTKFRIDNIVRTHFLQILSLKFYPCYHYYYYLIISNISNNQLAIPIQIFYLCITDIIIETFFLVVHEIVTYLKSVAFWF